eukprot:6938674-Prorocentrum_lima.AAC.1
MTSSLVGSEMCIRDSVMAHLEHMSKTTEYYGLVIRENTWVLSQHAPVSYTHLTLPTICSV